MKYIGQISSHLTVFIISIFFLPLIHTNAFCIQTYSLQKISGTINIPDIFYKADNKIHQAVETHLASELKDLSEKEKRMYVKRDAIYYKKIRNSYPDVPFFTIQSVFQKGKRSKNGFLNYAKEVEKLQYSSTFNISKAPIINYSNNSLYYEVDIEESDLFPWKNKLFIYNKLHKYGIIIIHYLAKESNYPKELETFLDITKSIRIPSEQEIE